MPTEEPRDLVHSLLAFAELFLPSTAEKPSADDRLPKMPVSAYTVIDELLQGLPTLNMISLSCADLVFLHLFEKS